MFLIESEYSGCFVSNSKQACQTYSLFLRSMEATVLLEPSSATYFFIYLFFFVVAILHSAIIQFLCSAQSTVDRLCVDMAVFTFPNHLMSIYFSTGGLQAGVETYSKLRSQLSSVAKDLNTQPYMIYGFSFFKNISKILFSVCPY